ncbi:hypothetical protein ABPG75_013525 [Micractinium tetrahymenae]
MAPSTVVGTPHGPLELPPSTKVPLERANPVLSCAIGKWLKAHGKTVKPKLSESQKADARMCFKLMDADGSGAIDAEELGAAFRLLGINMSQREVEGMLAEVDRDGSGEVEYAEFLEIMTMQLTRLAQQKGEASPPAASGAGAPCGGSGPGAGLNMASVLPFDVVATAYRRKKLIGALEEDDKDFILSLAAAEEEEKQRAEAEAATAAAAAARRSSRRLSVAPLQGLGHSSLAAGRAAPREGAASTGGSRGGGGASPGPASHANFLDSLTREERRIIEALSRKYRGDVEAQPAHGAARTQRQQQQQQQQRQQQGPAASPAQQLADKAATALGPGSHLAALQQTAAAASTGQLRPASAAAMRPEDLNVQYRLNKTGPAMVAAVTRRSPSPPRGKVPETAAAAGAAVGPIEGLLLPAPLFSGAGFWRAQG